ncbi:MAG: DUF2520 domain-containing protein [Sphingopyxis sp.]|nr:DUF2520 domain-containing protein [Sphingopyxis sp.]MDZ3831396.1 DUF2520 domain-containing protein [Sphingopyxis sp.]
MTAAPMDRIGIIGAGRVAQALALGLAPHASAPPMLWARSSERLQTALANASTGAAAPSMTALVRESDVVAIAVSDDAMEAVAAEVAAALPAKPPRLIFHVSGRSGVSLLADAAAKGALTAAIHPAMTFTGNPVAEVQRMSGACFAITGSAPAATVQARRLVAWLGGAAIEIPEQHRPLYHAALCHAANHLVTLIAGASHALERAGVEHPGALLAPLVRAALDNSLSDGFAALSGPLLRGDAQTIEGHRDAIASDCPRLLPAYDAMAAATLDELARQGVSGERSALHELLVSPPFASR